MKSLRSVRSFSRLSKYVSISRGFFYMMGACELDDGKSSDILVCRI